MANALAYCTAMNYESFNSAELTLRDVLKLGYKFKNMNKCIVFRNKLDTFWVTDKKVDYKETRQLTLFYQVETS